MPKKSIPHPTLITPRLRLRQFRAHDVDAMHGCFAHPEAMRFWNQPVFTKRIETERAVRNFIDCTPSYYRFWAVAAAETDHCLGLVNYHDGNIRSKRASIGHIIDPTRQRQGMAADPPGIATPDRPGLTTLSIRTGPELAAPWTSREGGRACRDRDPLESAFRLHKRAKI